MIDARARQDYARCRVLLLLAMISPLMPLLITSPAAAAAIRVMAAARTWHCHCRRQLAAATMFMLPAICFRHAI